MTTTTESAKTRDWLVVAGICDCGHVALTLMDTWTPGSEHPDHDHEIVTVGTDWRAMVRDNATALHERTGCRISGMCTVVMLANPQGQEALRSEVTSFVYDVAEGRARA